jgi:hypothetical protein
MGDGKELLMAHLCGLWNTQMKQPAIPQPHILIFL